MNKLYKDHRKENKELYWMIDGDKVYHLIDIINPLTIKASKEIKPLIIKSDILILEYT